MSSLGQQEKLYKKLAKQWGRELGGEIFARNIESENFARQKAERKRSGKKSSGFIVSGSFENGKRR